MNQEPYTALGKKKTASLEDSICPNCGHKGLDAFYEVRNVPVHSCLMMENQEKALHFPSDDVILAYCDRCGFITNTEFDSKWSAYSPHYEDQQSFSPTFNKFSLDLANHLIEKFDLRNKNILEIGCSKGDFLFLMCELGNNHGVGIDPSVIPGRVKSEANERVTFIQDYYGEQHAKYVGDFICCRHTLEHIQPTSEFISMLRRSIGDRHVPVFFEIPDNTRVLQDLAFEDIYYEHCSYFTPGSLARLFRESGFEVTNLYRDYGGQYLFIEALPAKTLSEKVHPLEETMLQMADYVNHFKSNISEKLDRWKNSLEEMHADNQKVVVWGSGSKCVAFLTTLDTIDKIQFVIDINPHRHGKYIPGVGKQIMPPEFLKEYQPDRVILMNSIYFDEVNEMIEEMGVTTEIISL
ncbi:MAG: methyltransferase domain-containing protein [Synechococcus sp.]